VFGLEAPARLNAAQSTANRERGASAAEALVLPASPAMLFDAADLNRDVGVSADEDAVGEDPVLPTPVEESTLEEQHGHRPGVGDPELGHGRTGLEFTDPAGLRQRGAVWLRVEWGVSPHRKNRERTRLDRRADVERGQRGHFPPPCV
jgi:hypothetical protein